MLRQPLQLLSVVLKPCVHCYYCLNKLFGQALIEIALEL